MNKKLTPRYIIILIILVWAVYSLWPSLRYQGLDPEELEELREAGELASLEARTLRQGLDLKGGIYIVLEVDLPALAFNLAANRDQRLGEALEAVRNQLEANPQADFLPLFQEQFQSANLRLSRYFFEYGSQDGEIIDRLRDEAGDAIDRVLEILQNRVDQFGVSEPTIQKQGDQRIIVELAGIQDPERARALLQSTALLEFYIVKDPQMTSQTLVQIDRILKGGDELAKVAPDTVPSVPEPAPEEAVSDDRTISVSELFGATEAVLEPGAKDTSVVVDQRLFEERPFSSLLRNLGPATLQAIGTDIGVPQKNLYAVQKILRLPDVKEKLNLANGQFLFKNETETFTLADGGQEIFYPIYFLERESELTGGVVEEARATLGGQASTVAGQPIVNLTMNTEGARKWALVTGANVQRNVAIVLDKKVHMAPRIREKITGGGTQIEGFADINEAQDIAIVLRAGALPAPVTIIEERVVGPSLGADSVQKGTLSVLVGLGLVLVFIQIYYKLAGVVANFALIWNLLLILAVLAALKATLTLPGIAALILTVGMSIDANVIIFERIREELRKGKTPRAAVDGGYARALTTIIDANVTTVIAALVLYQFGTGPIRGFATVLFWGIVISMFTAVFVTRTIFNTYTSRKGIRKLSI